MAWLVKTSPVQGVRVITPGSLERFGPPASPFPLEHFARGSSLDRSLLKEEAIRGLSKVARETARTTKPPGYWNPMGFADHDHLRQFRAASFTGVRPRPMAGEPTDRNFGRIDARVWLGNVPALEDRPSRLSR